MDLPVWPPEPPTRAATEPAMLPPPPVVGAEDWDDPEGRTSIGNRAAPVAAEGSGPRESSVIVDLEAKSRAVAPDAPRRPQTYPVIQTSERNTTTSGVFSMPSAPVVGKGSQPEPVIPERASSGWNTPLPQALPGEPPGSPPVPSFPSAAGLDYHGARDTAIAEPVRQHDPTEPRIKRGPLLASVLPTPRSRRVALLAAAGVVAILGIVAVAGHGDPKPSTTAVVTHEPRTPSTSPRTSPASADHPVASTPGAVASTPGAAATTVATAEPSLPVATPNPTKPAKAQPVRRRISRAKKPVVVDYDKQRDPASADSPDQALAKARAAYAAGNQHLFAGETSSAIASYQQALSLYPGYVAGYRGLGLAYAQASNRPAAVDAFKTYVRLAPTAKDVALIQKRIANLSVR
jgi:hypothetical protein